VPRGSRRVTEFGDRQEKDRESGADDERELPAREYLAGG
jgi:hypothetical protein